MYAFATKSSILRQPVTTRQSKGQCYSSNTRKNSTGLMVNETEPIRPVIQMHSRMSDGFPADRPTKAPAYQDRLFLSLTNPPAPQIETTCQIAFPKGWNHLFSPSGEGRRVDDTITHHYNIPQWQARDSVRIHTDSASAQTARILNADAYTLGNHIAFAPGMYQPQSPKGCSLLIHELEHTMQNNRNNDVILRQTSDPEKDKRSAALQRIINFAAEEVDSALPSYKVLLQTFISAARLKGLREFGMGLAQIPNPRFGTYLNGFLIYIHARGSEDLAQVVVKEFNRAGLELIKSGEEPSYGTDNPEISGAALGSIIAYEGKTLVKIGNTNFYISGKPPDYWKGKSTSVFFIIKEANPQKMYRLDYDILKQGPNAGLHGWEHNQEGVARLIDLKVTNHKPAERWGKAAARSLLAFKWGGRVLFIVGVGYDIVNIYLAIDRRRAVLGSLGSLGGAAAGAAMGAKAGSRVPGPWQLKAGAIFLGGVAGGWMGSKIARAATEMTYDLFITPLEQERWFVFEESEVILPGREVKP